MGAFSELRRAFTAADVRAYADLGGDDNKVHLDAAYAATTQFKAPIVHGMLTSSLIPTLFGAQATSPPPPPPPPLPLLSLLPLLPLLPLPLLFPPRTLSDPCDVPHSQSLPAPDYRLDLCQPVAALPPARLY